MSEKLQTTVNEQDQNSIYACAFPNLSMVELLLLAPSTDSYEATLSIRIFLTKYHAYPCMLYYSVDDTDKLLHTTTITDYLRNELKHDLNTDQITETYNSQTEQMDLRSRLSDLGNGVMIEMRGIRLVSEMENPNKLKPDDSNGHFSVASTMKFYYLPRNRTLIQELASRFSKMTVIESKPEPDKFTLQMVCRDRCGYYLSSINIKKPLIIDLALHYGNAFLAVHEKIIENLNRKEEKGIVLLHGIPGSGRLNIFSF